MKILWWRALMNSEKQLDEAVARGIITEDQRNTILADVPDGDQLVAFDEAPRFFRSFNDIFIGLGVVLLGVAIGVMTRLFPGSEDIAKMVVPAFGAIVFWLMAEWLARIRRINFPSIVIAVGFLIFVAQFATNFWAFFSGADLSSLGDVAFLKKLGVACKLGFISVLLYAFFARFKLPFSILLLTGALCMTLFSVLILVFGSGALEPYLRWIVLAIGITVFIIAMWFDTQDPMRSKRTSDHGFWLHLLAAPIITHSVLWTTLQPIIQNAKNADFADDLVVGVILTLFLAFSLIALIIDRRALLISSLGYASAALTYIIYKFDVGENLAFVLTLLLIATLILALGTGWQKLRKSIFQVLPDRDFLRKLPPVKT